MDYKRKFLEEKVKSLQMERELVVIRFNEIMAELPTTAKELEELEKKKDDSPK
jgi:hypothetical protein